MSFPFIFDQPKFNEDGSCPIIKELGTPYDLRKWYPNSDLNLIKKDIESLYTICHHVYNHSQCDWFGIYLLMEADLLVKHAYIGEYSKAEFKVNEAQSKISNNSRVAFYGSDILINDIHNYNGPYYQCDSKVQSEYCLALINNNQLLGIIDVEDFRIDFFKGKEDYFKSIASSIAKFLMSSYLFNFIDAKILDSKRIVN
jgi:putative methionine-R-sulfoxide reductase with GAF domain